MLQAQRIVNEERLLEQDAEYARYAEQVQHRLVPYVF
jgi:protein-S-isoprenylcysteine O-methyltransferase Ste14